MAKIISLAGILESTNAKHELQNEVAKLVGCRFGWHHNDKISATTLQAVVKLSEYREKLFDASELSNLERAPKAAKAAAFSMLLDALGIEDVLLRKRIMQIPLSNCEREFPVQVLKMFA